MSLHQLQRMYVKGELLDAVGRSSVLDDPSDLAPYAVDYFWVPRMYVDRNEPLPLPDFVVLPNSEEEVRSVVRLAAKYRIPVIPWGGGSGSQGGILPVYGGITVDLKRLNRITELNAESQYVEAQGGINGYDLECALNEQGYTLGHLPASIHSATLGGYLACRGSGVLSTKYGKMEDIVMSVRVVMPDGEVIETFPVPNHACGPGLLHLFVGAEGVYGTITSARCKIERLPKVRRFHAYLFDTLHDGLEAGRRIMLGRLGPSLMRLYDAHESTKRVKHVLGLDLKDKNYFVIGFEGDPEIVAIQEKRAAEICRETAVEELDSSAAEEWWKHRYSFYFPPKALDFPIMFGTMDTLCTFDKMENLYHTKKARLESQFSEWNLQYIAHFSHWYPWGVMVYDRFTIQDPPRDAETAFLLHNAIWDVAVRTSIECGGIMNEHHGVGLKLARLVREQYGTSFTVLEAVKNGLDPNNIMNPGKMGFGPTR